MRMPKPDPAPPSKTMRPLCPNCFKVLRPCIEREWGRDERPDKSYATKVVSRRWVGKYHSYGPFCTLNCSYEFAEAAYKAGYRRKVR